MFGGVPTDTILTWWATPRPPWPAYEMSLLRIGNARIPIGKVRLGFLWTLAPPKHQER